MLFASIWGKPGQKSILSSQFLGMGDGVQDVMELELLVLGEVGGQCNGIYNPPKDQFDIVPKAVFSELL